MFDKKHSLTGNEFLDYVSWCEVMGYDVDGTKKDEQDYEEVADIDSLEEQQFIDEYQGDIEEDSYYKSLKMKGRDKNE